jgi:hypothetical protein
MWLMDWHQRLFLLLLLLLLPHHHHHHILLPTDANLNLLCQCNKRLLFRFLKLFYSFIFQNIYTFADLRPGLKQLKTKYWICVLFQQNAFLGVSKIGSRRRGRRRRRRRRRSLGGGGRRRGCEEEEGGRGQNPTSFS